MRRLLMATLVLIVCAVPAWAQPPRNPTQVQWDESADHAALDTYVMDITRVSDDVVIQTLDLGLGTLVSGVTRSASINVQPVTFGTYYVFLRGVAGGIESDNSDPSNQWERAPGRPSVVVVQ